MVDLRRQQLSAARVTASADLMWGVICVGAQAVSTAGWVIAETWQGPRYGPVQDTISDLQARTAPNVWFPILCFAIGALGTFGFAVFGLRPALARAGNIHALGPWMLALSALALGNSFPLIPCRLSDPGCTSNVQLLSPGELTDAIVAGLAFFVLAITPFPLWRRMAVLPSWRRLKPVMYAALVLGPVSFGLLAISSSTSSMPAVGLIERILAMTCALWICALAINLIVELRHARRPRDAPPRMP